MGVVFLRDLDTTTPEHQPGVGQLARMPSARKEGAKE